MGEVSIRSYHDENYLMQRPWGTSDAPAFIKRARRMQEMLESLLQHCGQTYEEHLKKVRVALTSLALTSRSWSDLASCFDCDEDVKWLRSLCETLAIEPAWAGQRARSPRALRREFEELKATIRNFNRGWRSFLKNVDLGPVNEARAGYNRYYVLEKECAVRSLRVARQGFIPVPALTKDDLTSMFPCLALHGKY
jgi:hypothetical protein